MALAVLPSRSAESSTALGQSLGGETCRLANGGDILCGSTASPAGSLHTSRLGQALPSDLSARRVAILAAAHALPHGMTTVQDVNCDAGQWLGASSDRAIFLCALRGNGWPHVVIVTASPTELVVAEGLPSLLPVLETAAASASGQPVSDAEKAEATRLVQARYNAGAMRSASGDLAGYDTLIETARIYGGADNYAGAEDAYRRSLEIESNLFGPESLAVGETLVELALQVSNQGRFDEARALFDRATPIIESAASDSARARLASYRALDAANRRAYADALKYARLATALRRTDVDAAKQASASGNYNTLEPTAPATLEGELAHSLRIEAEMALRLGDTAGAQAAAEEALWIITEEPGLPLWWRPEMVSLMGEVNAAQGRVVIAERDFADALDLDKKLFGDTAPTAQAALTLGGFYSGQQVYGPAIETYRTAFAILAKDPVARASVVPDQIVPFFAAATAQGLAKPELRSALDADMFRAVQFVNSGVADRTIAHVAARQAAGNSALGAMISQLDAAEHDRDTARLELAAENAKSNDQRDSSRVAKFEDQLKTAQTNADAIRVKIAAAYPDYAKMADPGPVELDAFRAKLAPDEVFVAFVIGAKSGYALAVSRGDLVAKPLTATTDGIAADVAGLREAFVPRLGRMPDFSLKSSYALYEQLMAPIEPALKGATHLVVAPGPSLDSLPLALLVTSDPGNAHYSDAAWLVRRMAVNQVPSPRALVALRSENVARAPRPFFGVGNPTYTGGAQSGRALSALAASCQQSGIADPELLRALPPLPETAGEVQSVGRSLGAQPGSILLGAAATEQAVRGAPLDQYSVLYFATHGVLPGELHCQSEPGLVLSPPAGAAASAAGDGLLTASEIASLRLNADLVVLSACNTAAGGGTQFGGGALEGLADSFFDAGARSVLASHWQVPSASTEKLMTGVFGRYGKGGTDLSEALRQAQLSLIADPATAHPYNWAAFTLIGDGGAHGAKVARGTDHEE
jgi:CHAT domain-containing protein